MAVNLDVIRQWKPEFTAKYTDFSKKESLFSEAHELKVLKKN